MSAVRRAAEAVEGLVGLVRKGLGKTGATVQINATARSLTGLSAYELLMAHRQIDLDVLPTGSFAAEDEVAKEVSGAHRIRSTLHPADFIRTAPPRGLTPKPTGS